jgi:hypothetical protein
VSKINPTNSFFSLNNCSSRGGVIVLNYMLSFTHLYARYMLNVFRLKCDCHQVVIVTIYHAISTVSGEHLSFKGGYPEILLK